MDANLIIKALQRDKVCEDPEANNAFRKRYFVNTSHMNYAICYEDNEVIGAKAGDVFELGIRKSPPNHSCRIYDIIIIRDPKSKEDIPMERYSCIPLLGMGTFVYAYDCNMSMDEFKKYINKIIKEDIKC